MFTLLKGARGRGGQPDDFEIANFAFDVFDDALISFRVGVVCFVDDKINFVFARKPGIKPLKVTANAVLADD